jgi:transcriptional regulator with XRE-family HTH domain
MKNNVFGKTLKQLRLDYGLSQRQLGERLGFCNQTISFWESGQREPDLDALVEIAKYFNVSIDLLLGFSN